MLYLSKSVRRFSRKSYLPGTQFCIIYICSWKIQERGGDGMGVAPSPFKILKIEEKLN